jgi:hypothetical protein
VVLPRQPRASVEVKDRESSGRGLGVDQPAGDAGHQRAQALTGRPAAAQGGGADRHAVAISFCCRLIQPLQDRAHPAFEYWGQSDPTRVAQRKVSKAEMIARAKNIFGGRIRNKECPKVLGIYSPADPVSLRPQSFLRPDVL